MSKYSSDHCPFLSRSLVTPRHRWVIMHEVVDESLRKICHYQKNVPQHYYLLDNPVDISHYNLVDSTAFRVIYQTPEIVFEHISKHREES